MQALTVSTLKEVLTEAGIPATLRYFGTPAEELLAGKSFLARKAVFQGVDVMFDCHGAGMFSVSHGTENAACFSMLASFRGKTAHAGGRPWDGRSAADAVELMHAGTERLREHMLPDQRIHWTTLGEAGAAPNIVPDLARTWYMLRSADDLAQDLYERVVACAHGAAMMTSTSVTIELLAACHQRYSSKALAQAFFANMQKVGVPEYTPQEHEFIRTLQKTIAAPEKGMDVAVVIEDAAKVPAKGGSSDVGDVTLIAPCATLRYPVWAPGAQSHTWAVTACTKTSIAHKGIDVAALVSCLTAVDILTKADVLQGIRNEFAELSAKRPFVSFIPEDAVPPLYWNEEAMSKYR
jgi:aminobenzoyl-glutamate utilization protein B